MDLTVTGYVFQVQNHCQRNQTAKSNLTPKCDRRLLLAYKTKNFLFVDGALCIP